MNKLEQFDRYIVEHPDVRYNKPVCGKNRFINPTDEERRKSYERWVTRLEETIGMDNIESETDLNIRLEKFLKYSPSTHQKDLMDYIYKPKHAEKEVTKKQYYDGGIYQSKITYFYKREGDIVAIERIIFRDSKGRFAKKPEGYING